MTERNARVRKEHIFTIKKTTTTFFFYHLAFLDHNYKSLLFIYVLFITNSDYYIATMIFMLEERPHINIKHVAWLSLAVVFMFEDSDNNPKWGQLTVWSSIYDRKLNAILYLHVWWLKMAELKDPLYLYFKKWIINYYKLEYFMTSSCVLIWTWSCNMELAFHVFVKS